MAQGRWNLSASQTDGFSSITQTSYYQGSGATVMSSPLYWTGGLGEVNGTGGLDSNHSFPQICDSNGTTIWKLTSPVCSTRFESFVSVLVVAVVLALVTLWTVVGNVGVVLALYHYRTLRTMSNCLIGNLAVSDLLLAVTVLPVSTTNDVLGYWVFGETMCTIWLCIDVLYCTASIWGLCTIAFDRYTATVYPMWYHDHRSSKKLVVYIVFVWVFSIIISFAPFIGWPDMIPSFHSYSPVLNRFECVLFSTQSYVFYSAIGSFVLPICLMVFLYIRIFSVIHKQSRSLKSKSNLSCFTANTSANENGYPELISPDGETNAEVRLPRDETGLTMITEVSPVTEHTYFLAVDGLTHLANTDTTLNESDIQAARLDYKYTNTTQAGLDYKCANTTQPSLDYKNSDVQQAVLDYKKPDTKDNVDYKTTEEKAVNLECKNTDTSTNLDYNNSDTKANLDYRITEPKAQLDYKASVPKRPSPQRTHRCQPLQSCSPDCEAGYVPNPPQPRDSPLPDNGLRTPGDSPLPDNGLRTPGEGGLLPDNGLRTPGDAPLPDNGLRMLRDSLLPDNGLRTPGGGGLLTAHSHLNGRAADAKRSKSVSIVTECSSDSSDDKRALGRRPSRALPWSSVEPARRMTISMTRRLELREQRATKRMMLIMASFCFCWVPFLVMYVTRSLYADFYINDHFAAAIIWLGYANSGLNPVLYTLFNEDFKKAFKKLLHIGNHRQPF